MKKLINLEALKMPIGGGKSKSEIKPTITFTKKTGCVSFNKKLSELMKLASGGRVGFAEKMQAVGKTDDVNSAVVVVKKGDFYFTSKGFTNYVFKELEIEEEVLAIKIEVSETPDEDNFYPLDLNRIIKRIPVNG